MSGTHDIAFLINHRPLHGSEPSERYDGVARSPRRPRGAFAIAMTLLLGIKQYKLALMYAQSVLILQTDVIFLFFGRDGTAAVTRRVRVSAAFRSRFHFSFDSYAAALPRTQNRLDIFNRGQNTMCAQRQRFYTTGTPCSPAQITCREPKSTVET